MSIDALRTTKLQTMVKKNEVHIMNVSISVMQFSKNSYIFPEKNS